MGDDGDSQARTVEVVVWHPDGTAVARPSGLRALAIGDDDDHRLPALLDEIRATLQIDVVLLQQSSDTAHVRVVGTTDPSTMAAIDALPWAEPTEADVRRDRSQPWYELGWFVATRAQLTDILAGEPNATVIGPLRQEKHWSIGTLLEVPTDRGSYWYKQVPAFMAHEARLTRWLAARRPGWVPEVVAAGEDWSLMRAFPDPPRWDDAGRAEGPSPYRDLAELQIEIARGDVVGELLSIGCVDRRPSTLVDDLAELAARPGVFPEEIGARLGRATGSIAERTDALVAALPPWVNPSLVHGDLHQGNWTSTAAGGWLVFDWTDGAVAHPFMDMGVLPSRDADLRRRWLDDYLGPWRDVCGGAGVDAAWRLAEPLTFGFHAVSYQRIIDGLGQGASSEWSPAVTWFATRLLDGLDGLD